MKMDNSDDEIEICQSVGPHFDDEEVKSQAVVKFSAVLPVNFNRLQCNTNLNLPPSNWLTTSDGSYGLHQALYHSAGFASFRMAHMFPDCVGEVDVVSDAENIKKLLKLPYNSKSVISMIVHKVGNTLLLDEFDIQKYLLRQANDDWKWLRTFILEQILSYGDKNHNLCLKDKSREAIQTKNLLSKFLYHSLKQSCEEESPHQSNEMRLPLPLTGPVLPEPKVEENVPDPKSNHVFNRNVVWTFEDIRMLIGTDMPIFGGPNRPCISLRLRDMAKPINVLTGIDYWLDNLMCNVPEVVMCYHLDGIVQKYEIIKTEDLPYLENSQFSPKVVRNVAQNILSFLKANATKSGHTYWLFKGRNDDVVKLYDLTTLCQKQTGSNSSDRKPENENPFTVPVAMLLYTVARNMKNTATHITPKKAGSIRALLDNCIKLLPKEKYPQIVTSSHYILSDLHVPAGIDPKSPRFDTSDLDSDTQSVYEEEEQDEEEDSDEDTSFDDFRKELSEESANVAVQNICDTLKEFNNDGTSYKNSKRLPHRPTPLMADIDERCRISLEHISAGLSCLKFFDTNEEKFVKESKVRAKDEEKQRILEEEQNPNMAKPFKPIPLPYESLSERPTILQKTASTDQEEANTEDERSLPNTSKERKNKKPRNKRTKGKELKETITISSKPTIEAATNAALLQKSSEQINFNSQLFGSWNVHLKLLLIEKACLTYATLAEHNYVEKKYGGCLKAIYMSCRCQQVVMKYMSTMVSQKSCLLGRAGDCFFQMARNWQIIDKYIDQFKAFSEAEEYISSELDKDLNKDDMDELIEPIKSLEHLMVSSCTCYENALECLVDNDEEAKQELLRRLGNVRNELGLNYMYFAQDEFTKFLKADIENLESTKEIHNTDAKGRSQTTTEPAYVKYAMQSYDCLTRGIAAFTEGQDKINLAFLYCNMGRFMRFRAHLQMPDEENVDCIQKCKTFYSEAFANYAKAKDALGSRKCHTELWDLVNWELSSATFILAKQLQDFSTADNNTTTVELEKEVLDLLQKSLTLCDTEHPGSRQILYAYRSGLIHKRIASFHYSQLRRNYSETSGLPKTILQLCKYHYEKAANILESLKEEISDFLVVQLERISLQEFLTEKSSNVTQKIKHMQFALEICLSSKTVFEHGLHTCNANEQQTTVTTSTATTTATATATATTATNTTIPTTNEEFYNHMTLFESRLQFALKTLIKLLLSSKDPKKLANVYKKMYAETLTAKKTLGEQKLPHEQLAQHLLSLLERLNQSQSMQNKNIAEQQ